MPPRRHAPIVAAEQRHWSATRRRARGRGPSLASTTAPAPRPSSRRSGCDRQFAAPEPRGRRGV